jgi:superfamily II DNA or RNA helicase
LEPKDKSKIAEVVLCEIPHCGALISSLLPPDPPFSGGNFALTLAEFYHRAAAFELWQNAEGGENLEHRFSRSRWTLRCADPAPGSQPILEETDVRGQKHAYSVFESWRRFAAFAGDDGGEDYVFLFYLFKFLGFLVHSCAFIPFVHITNGTLAIVWKPYGAIPQIAKALDAIAMLEPGLLFLKSKNQKRQTRASGRSVVDLLASAFLNEWVRQNWFTRGQSGSHDFRELLQIFFWGVSLPVDSPATRSLPLAIDRWLSVLHIDFAKWNYCFTVKQIEEGGPRRRNTAALLPPGAHVVAPHPPLRGQDENGFAPPQRPQTETPDTNIELETALDFALSLDVLLKQKDERIIKTPLSKITAGKRTGLSREDKISVLRAPTALSNYLPEIHDLMAHNSVALSEARLASFLESGAPLLSKLGITVNLPKALSRELKPRLVMQTASKNRGAMVSFLGLDTLLDWKWQIAIGERIFDEKEFAKLIKQKRALVRFRDGFVKIDAEELASLLKKARADSPGVNDFLKAHLSGDSVLSFDAEQVIQKLFEERRFAPPASLKADLRPYQLNGYNWVCSLLMAGFGCVLADDMGLGKTVQAIAALLRLREEGLLLNGCLIVAPAALLENWEKELFRFAPSLSVMRYHGTARALNRKKHQVFLTTYQTAARDAAKLEAEIFSLLIVDEAHLMKNAETRIARAVKKLRPQFRLALSGTPVENRLEDLRSLFDFILPGYLGGAAEFRKEYRYPIEALRQSKKAEALRKITSPFLLRRLKTDRTIIKDLPQKITSNEYAVLEKEQAALYESIVSETMKKSETIENEKRSALVLSLLTSLKQVCDHPRVYDKESPPLSALSGKARLLLTLLGEIIDGGEKVLVFSQYVETLDCLNCMITSELGEASLLYHGGMNQKTRTAVIERFQNDASVRVLLISLKAGGLGLNLTAASRVIHYDLWFNPAVENQATDRAFRIGQKRNVFVHRLITKNSFEETIDEMIASKKELAEMTVASGESWLMRMSHEELKALFTR